MYTGPFFNSFLFFPRSEKRQVNEPVLVLVDELERPPPVVHFLLGFSFFLSTERQVNEPVSVLVDELVRFF